MASSPYKKAKAAAWTAFSRYIRTRDCIKTTGSVEKGKCFTCENIYPFEQLQAGHFLDGRMNGILFDEQCVHAQCYACNVMKHGNKVLYTLKMQEVYGQEVVDRLLAKRYGVVKFTTPALKSYAENYKQRTKALEQEARYGNPTTDTRLRGKATAVAAGSGTDVSLVD